MRNSKDEGFRLNDLIFPTPQKLIVSSGRWYPSYPLQVAYTGGEEVAHAVQLISEVSADFGVGEWQLGQLSVASADLLLDVISADCLYAMLERVARSTVDRGTISDAYILSISDGKACIQACTPRGLYYGGLTFVQIMANYDGTIPEMTIADWPDFAIRMTQYDLARGQIVNVEFLKELIRELSRARYNYLVVYMEDDYIFKSYPFLGKEDGLTENTAQELSRYAQEHFIDLIPQFQSLAHTTALLSHTELKEFDDGRDATLEQRSLGPIHGLIPGQVLDVANPKLYEFLRQIYAELLCAFNTPSFLHVGLDEAWGFGRSTRAQAAAEKLGGIGALFYNHLMEIYRIAKELETRLIYWDSAHLLDEMVKQVPQEKLEPILENTYVMPWNHIASTPSDFRRVRVLRDYGFRHIVVAGGVFAFSCIYYDFMTTAGDISSCASAAKQYDCEGICINIWEMVNGNLYQHLWYGVLYGANCAWNSEATSVNSFDHTFARYWFGLPAGYGRLIARAIHPYGVNDDGSSWWGPPSERWKYFRSLSTVFWSSPDGVKKMMSVDKSALFDPQTAVKLYQEAQDAIGALREVDARAQRHRDTLPYIESAARMYSIIAEEIMWAAINRISGERRRTMLQFSRNPIVENSFDYREIPETYLSFIPVYEMAINTSGAWGGIINKLEGQAKAWAEEIQKHIIGT